MRSPRANFPPCRLRRTFSASLDEIDRICQSLRRKMTRLHYPHSSFRVEILLREMLTNAVRHGCRMDKRLKVRLDMTLRPASFRILVADPGPGFNWQRQLRQPTHPDATHGRGLQILKRYCDAVYFNKRGNILLVKRRFPCVPTRRTPRSQAT